MDKMTNKEVKNFLIQVNIDEGYGDELDSVEEMLTESHVIEKEEIAEHRWYRVFEYITKIKDKYISYQYARADGDNHPHDMGWEFDWNGVKEVFPVEETKIVYK